MKINDKITKKWEDFKTFDKTYFNYGWDVANEVLYNMCEFKSLEECEPKEIAARLLIIGRTYAATIERNTNGNDCSTDNLYKTISENGKWKNIIDDLKSNDITNNYKKIFDTHNKLVELLRAPTNNNKVSLASKFLHFHKKDVFYIYDERTRIAVTHLYPGRLSKEDKEKFGCTTSNTYSNFFIKVKAIADVIGEDITPRMMDNFLLYVYQHRDD